MKLPDVEPVIVIEWLLAIFLFGGGLAFIGWSMLVQGWPATVVKSNELVIRPYIFKYNNFYLTVHNMWHHNELKLCSKNL